MKRGGNAPATPAPETADSAHHSSPPDGAESPKTETPPPAGNPEDPAGRCGNGRLAGDPDGTWTPGGGEEDDSVPVDEPATGDIPPWNALAQMPGRGTHLQSSSTISNP